MEYRNSKTNTINSQKSYFTYAWRYRYRQRPRQNRTKSKCNRKPNAKWNEYGAIKHWMSQVQRSLIYVWCAQMRSNIHTHHKLIESFDINLIFGAKFSTVKQHRMHHYVDLLWKSLANMAKSNTKINRKSPWNHICNQYKWILCDVRINWYFLTVAMRSQFIINEMSHN